MLSHLILPVGRRWGRRALAALALAALIGCGGASPQVHVIGVAPAAERSGQVSGDRVVVFLEVVNRTGREIELSGLEYRLSAPAWFDAEGTLAVRRHVDADSSVVVELPVELRREQTEHVDKEVDYRLEGRIIARENRVERSWAVSSTGRLRASEGGASASPVRVRVASGE